MILVHSLACSSAPNHTETLVHKAHFLRRHGDVEGALAILSSEASRSYEAGDATTGTLFAVEKAKILAKAVGNEAQARETFRAAGEKSPSKYLLASWLAFEYQRAGASTFPRFSFQLGRIYFLTMAEIVFAIFRRQRVRPYSRSLCVGAQQLGSFDGRS
jgi:hypothetical protein